ncbi:hypothetical protein FWF89_01740 [Candidatus Saccharibacteria bacterium]|nr:hypothetical protein [Candidatus Saccharibacteria bacterium]
MKNKKRLKRNKLPIVMLVLLALIAAAVVFYFLMLVTKSTENSSSEIDSSINYNPPTQDEISAGENIKKDNEDKNAQTIADYSIFIVDASQYGQSIEVKAYVESLIRDGGTCTFTFSKGPTVVIKTSRGFADATHTNCETLTVPISEFPASGIWSLLITYSLGGITANSSNYDVEVTK